MNHLAPRQGLFAVILLASFCLHLLVLALSSEKQQYDYRTNKGEKIVEQLSKEALVAVSNQDRISLSVLANRYQLDSDVARLTISGADKTALVQTGVAQNDMGQVIEKPIIQNNQQVGQVAITMKAVSNGEVLASQWLFILGSAVLHIFLWFIYRYNARPTQEQLLQIGEKVQQRVALAPFGVPTANVSQNVPQDDKDSEKQTPPSNERPQATDNKTGEKAGFSIQSYLQQQQAKNPSTSQNIATTPTETADNLPKNLHQQTMATEYELALQIRFYDEFKLLERLAPEVAQPYLHLCEQLLKRACDSLLGQRQSVLNQAVKSVTLKQLPYFDKHGAVVHLTGKSEEVTLASVLLAKLILILNQVVYEKHRELSRFALPMSVGVSTTQQFSDVQHLMQSHAKEDGLLLLFPKNLLTLLNKSVQVKHINNPISIAEREMVRYEGLSQVFMKELIGKRDDILTSTERYQMSQPI